MTKEVMVTLSGLQLGDSGEDTVETVHIGEYYEKNGVHYLFFDELLEGHKTPIRNMLKLRNEKLEVRKRGPVSAELVFEEGEVTEEHPDPPYHEILKKNQRAYNCLLFQSHYDYYICVPYRSEISHPYSFKFKKTQRSKSHRSGLDYTKIVIITKSEYIDTKDAQ